VRKAETSKSYRQRVHESRTGCINFLQQWLVKRTAENTFITLQQCTPKRLYTPRWLRFWDIDGWRQCQGLKRCRCTRCWTNCRWSVDLTVLTTFGILRVMQDVAHLAGWHLLRCCARFAGWPRYTAQNARVSDIGNLCSHSKLRQRTQLRIGRETNSETPCSKGLWFENTACKKLPVPGLNFGLLLPCRLLCA